MIATEIQKYSQGEEQQHILSALQGVSGRFLDIGSWNPKVFSNTRALFELGWGGVMIEPSPEPFLSLLKEYGEEERITLILGAVGFQNGLQKFFATDDCTSTSDEQHYLKWKEIGGVKYYGAFNVPLLTWADLTNRFGSFEFVSIDAEGISADLFLGLLKTGMRPKCICVEHDNREAELARLAGPLGYRVIFGNGENLVFSL